MNGFAAGGSSDTVARLIAQKLSESLKQEVIVETRTGAGGVVANEFVTKAAPDGYTLVLITGAYPVQPGMLKTLPYDPLTGFSFISTLTFYPFVFVTSPTISAAKRAAARPKRCATTSRVKSRNGKS